MQHGVRKAVVLRAEVAADASRDVMACVVGVPTATVARYSLARATLLSTMAFRVSRPSCRPPSLPLVPFSLIAILFLALDASAREIIRVKKTIFSVETIFTRSQLLFLAVFSIFIFTCLSNIEHLALLKKNSNRTSIFVSRKDCVGECAPARNILCVSDAPY